MKKCMSLLLVLSLAVSLLAGCGSNTASSSPPASGESTVQHDISKRVELRMLSLADAPNNEKLYKEFWDVLNAELLEKLNCTIKFEYVEGYDPIGQYELALAANEPYDLMHASGGLNYASAANRGAFMDITELVPIYAPDLYKLVSEKRWGEAKVNGKVYGIPNLAEKYTSHSFMYREDLRKKYNCEPITDLETMGAYLQAIVDNEPALIATDDQAGPLFRRAFQYTGTFAPLDSNMNFMVDPKNPRKVISAYEMPEYLEYLKLAKEWFDNGYWTSNVLSSKEWGVNSVINGKAAASFTGQFPWYAWHPPFIEKQNPGWEIEFFQYINLNENAFIAPSAATEDMVAVAQKAENPERALMVLNLIQTDEELWRLCTYGMEGTNYELTSDGKIDTSNFAEETRFNYFPVNMFANDEFTRAPADQWDQYDAHFQVIHDKAQKDFALTGFAPDTTGVIEAQYTAVNQVRVEYAYPLQAGMTDDVEAGYADLLKRVEAAGIEECRQELERQVNAFLDAKGVE